MLIGLDELEGTNFAKHVQSKKMASPRKYVPLMMSDMWVGAECSGV